VTEASASRPYITATAETHAGNSIPGYREYLDPGERADFDEWRTAIEYALVTLWYAYGVAIISHVLCA